jgi:hypothetical protein
MESLWRESFYAGGTPPEAVFIGSSPGALGTGLRRSHANPLSCRSWLRRCRPSGKLRPETQACDLYSFRPMTCRLFGPAVRVEGGAVGACELCYQGASDEEIAECAVEMAPYLTSK